MERDTRGTAALRLLMTTPARNLADLGRRGAHPLVRRELPGRYFEAVREARYDTKLWMRDLMEGAAYLPK